MMKVRLLNDGGFSSLANVNFPVEVEATFDDEVEDNSAIYVSSCELIAVGGDSNLLASPDERYFVDDEFEVVDE